MIPSPGYMIRRMARCSGQDVAEGAGDGCLPLAWRRLCQQPMKATCWQRHDLVTWTTLVAILPGDLLLPESSTNTIFPIVLIKESRVAGRQRFRNTGWRKAVFCPNPTLPRARGASRLWPRLVGWQVEDLELRAGPRRDAVHFTHMAFPQ